MEMAGDRWDGQPHKHVPHTGTPLDPLLRKMLAQDAGARPSAHECLLDPYFRQSEAVRARAAGEVEAAADRLLNARAKIEVARREIWDATDDTYHVDVDREQIVKDGLECMYELSTAPRDGFGARRRRDSLCSKLYVCFEGESGVDQGGLTSEFYTELWRAIAAGEGGLFESNEDPRNPGARGKSLPVAGALNESKRKQLRSVGILIAKTIFDGRRVRRQPQGLSKSAYQQLWTVPCAISRMEQGGAHLAGSLAGTPLGRLGAVQIPS